MDRSWGLLNRKLSVVRSGGRGFNDKTVTVPRQRQKADSLTANAEAPFAGAVSSPSPTSSANSREIIAELKRVHAAAIVNDCHGGKVVREIHYDTVCVRIKSIAYQFLERLHKGLVHP